MRMDCDDESQAEAAEYLDEILLASRHLNQLLGKSSNGRACRTSRRSSSCSR